MKKTVKAVPVSGKRFPVPKCTQGGTDYLCPKFSFEFLDGDFCLTKCQNGEKGNFAAKLHHIGHQTWRELRQLGRDNGFEPIQRARLHCKIPPRFQEESQAVVFHMTGNIPLIGYRDQGVFYVIAVDRNFSAYRHGA